MLGEIFGLNAGLTCTELVLLRFLLGRPVVVGFVESRRRMLLTDPVGDDATALSCGLGITELDALAMFAAAVAALVGPNRGVFLADSVGVV